MPVLDYKLFLGQSRYPFVNNVEEDRDLIFFREEAVEIKIEVKEEAVIFGMSLPGGYISSQGNQAKETREPIKNDPEWFGTDSRYLVRALLSQE